jgi:hypothetical protein
LKFVIEIGTWNFFLVMVLMQPSFIECWHARWIFCSCPFHLCRKVFWAGCPCR